MLIMSGTLLEFRGNKCSKNCGNLPRLQRLRLDSGGDPSRATPGGDSPACEALISDIVCVKVGPVLNIQVCRVCVLIPLVFRLEDEVLMTLTR